MLRDRSRVPVDFDKNPLIHHGWILRHNGTCGMGLDSLQLLMGSDFVIRIVAEFGYFRKLEPCRL